MGRAKLTGRTATAEVTEQAESPFPIMLVDTPAPAKKPEIRLATLRDYLSRWFGTDSAWQAAPAEKVTAPAVVKLVTHGDTAPFVSTSSVSLS